VYVNASNRTRLWDILEIIEDLLAHITYNIRMYIFIPKHFQLLNWHTAFIVIFFFANTASARMYLSTYITIQTISDLIARV
jgi:ABC-type uncharacterized transport system involved in gliding motility auxiliary subunit